MELTKLMKWEVHEAVLQMYTRAVAEEAIAGYEPISWEQVHRADVELFARIAEITNEDLSLPSDGSMPMDAAATAVMREHRFNTLLAPLPKRSPGNPKRESPSELEELRAENKRLKTAQSKGSWNPNAGKASGKGNKKGKSKRGTNNRGIPQSLRGIKPFGGRKYCYGYNDS
eukprot:12418457-Karenia_brevis.AAC.1